MHDAAGIRIATGEEIGGPRIGVDQRGLDLESQFLCRETVAVDHMSHANLPDALKLVIKLVVTERLPGSSLQKSADVLAHDPGGQRRQGLVQRRARVVEEDMQLDRSPTRKA